MLMPSTLISPRPLIELTIVSFCPGSGLGDSRKSRFLARNSPPGQETKSQGEGIPVSCRNCPVRAPSGFRVGPDIFPPVYTRYQNVFHGNGPDIHG